MVSMCCRNAPATCVFTIGGPAERIAANLDFRSAGGYADPINEVPRVKPTRPPDRNGYPGDARECVAASFPVQNLIDEIMSITSTI
jgi:hypothetical protein